MPKFKTTMNGAPELQGECGTARFDGDELFVYACDLSGKAGWPGLSRFKWEDLEELRRRHSEWRADKNRG